MYDLKNGFKELAKDSIEYGIKQGIIKHGSTEVKKEYVSTFDMVIFALYPHDLLKAYHLREIHDKYEMQNAVVKWESKQPKAIRELFDLYLFPIWNWAKRRKCGNFRTADIDIYKGIGEDSLYTYARRANKAMPYFLITEPFIAGCRRKHTSHKMISAVRMAERMESVKLIHSEPFG